MRVSRQPLFPSSRVQPASGAACSLRRALTCTLVLVACAALSLTAATLRGVGASGAAAAALGGGAGGTAGGTLLMLAPRSRRSWVAAAAAAIGGAAEEEGAGLGVDSGPTASAAASAPAPEGPSAPATQRAPFVRRFFSASSHDAALSSADGGDTLFPRVLVLTPVKNSQRHLPRFFALLRNLSYPPSRLALGILDSDSDDAPPVAAVAALLKQGFSAAEVEGMSGTLATALVELSSLERAGWAGATLVRHDFGFSLSRQLRHGREAQLERRAALARSRNHLLATSLRENDEFVLWIDSDLHSYPADVLQKLLSARRDIVVPNVVMAPGKRSYDLNSWRAAGAPGDNATVDQVVAFHNRRRGGSGSAAAGGGDLQLEGYGETGNVYLSRLRRAPQAGEAGGVAAVRLDAVGGAMLLVRAELHRMGLIYPPMVYRGRIETEGLSMMAMDMGVLSFGLPAVEVIHH